MDVPTRPLAGHTQAAAPVGADALRTDTSADRAAGTLHDRAAWVGLMAIVAVAGVLFIGVPLSAGARLATARVLLTLLPLAAVVLFARAARRAPAGRAMPWLLFAAAAGLEATGQAIFFVRQVVLVAPTPFPTISFFCYIAVHPLVAAGVVLALRPVRARGFALEVGLDMLLLLLAASVLLLHLVIRPVVAGMPGMSEGQLNWTLAGHLLAIGSALFTLLLVVWREPVLPPGTVAGLAGAFTLNAAISVLTAMGVDPDPAHPGRAFTVLWVLVWAQVAGAALAAQQPRAPRGAGPRRLPLPAAMRVGVVVAVILLLGAAASKLLGAGPPDMETRVVLVLITLVLVARWGLALRLAEREAGGRRALAHARALVDLSNALAAAPYIEPALDVVAEWACRLLDAHGAAIELTGPDWRSVPAAVGSLTPARGRQLRPTPTLLDWLSRGGEAEARTVPDARALPAAAELEIPPGTALAAAPLRFGGRTSGVLALALKGRELDRDELQLLGALAEQAAVALESHRLLEEARQAERRRFQSEKLSTVGQLAGGIAHEINNPLAAIQSAAELLLEDAGDEDENRRLLTLVRAEARRAGVIVRNLLELVRPREARVEAVDMAALLEDTLQLRAYAHNLQNVAVLRDVQDIGPVRGDPDRLRQVLLNLIINAEQALTDVKRRRIEIRGRMRDGEVEIAIADNGPGIPADHLDKVFEPFFTTKPVGQGTGLGLSVTYGIVRDLGGTILAANRPDGGAVFTVRLPAADRDAARAGDDDVAAPAEELGAGSASVLLVDDESAVREVAARSLRRAGFAVELADSGEAALELLQRQRFDVILSDIKMPGIGGEGLYRRLEEMRIPVLERFIFISGDIVADATTRFLADTGRPYLMKPFELRELVSAVRRVAGGATTPSPRTRT